ncbi:MAG TPA: cation:proton antiporter [Verrucomicrobiales bacterium]|nr:cation:proton antiporter [Verrucomicrobiales bacterium]
MHDLSLIATIAAAFTSAWLLGLLTQWLRLSPIVGYLLAGVLIGPHTPGFVGDVHLAQQLAEVGVILLMFGVGLQFHLKDLVAVKGVAIPGAIGQSLVATVLAMVIFSAFGMPLKSGAVLGMALAVASTVVLMRVLMDANALNSPQGHVAVGWLIVEDIFTVVLLVLIPVLGGGMEGAGIGGELRAAAGAGFTFWAALGVALLKLAALVAIVMLAGSRIVPWVLVRVAKLRSRELFTLTVLVFSIAIAAGSYFFFGASMALGAFLAGMVVAQSPVSHQAAADALPMRDAFAVLFFVSVGMLFDPAFLIQQPMMVAAALGIILVAKPAAALVIVAVLGHSSRTALTVAVGLAQIGEFSFILSELARRHGVMTDAGHNVLVAAAIISITLNPLFFRALPKIESWLRKRPRLWKALNHRAERRAAGLNEAASAVVAGAAGKDERLAIVVGYGPVGRSVHRVLLEAGLATVVIDLNMETVSALNAQGHSAIFGDASHESILEQAGARRASHLVLTIPHSSQGAAVVTAARSLNAGMRILARARYLRERGELERSGASVAVFEEAEAAVALARLVLADTGLHREAADRKIKDLRLQLVMENMSNIRSQRIGSVMVPWARVKWLPAAAERRAVLAQVAQERFSRWPVVEPRTGRATGYLLTKDLIAQAPGDDWSRLIRPLKSIRPDESVDSTLTRMQSEGATLFAVETEEGALGLVTLEDILEQVVGQLGDEYPRQGRRVSLADAVAHGAVVLVLGARTREQAIRELVLAIPGGRLPPASGFDEIISLALAREEEISTDLGNGVAIPHARCPGLAAPLIVVGRSAEGVVFSTASTELVRLLFLLITPAEQPETQLTLLAQLARVADTEASRSALERAVSAAEVMEILYRQRA